MADFAIVERVVITGDLSKLTPQERVEYYSRTCESLGLNPMTRPFDYVTLNGKMQLYARKDATDQLRQLRRISITIVSREKLEDTYVVTARAQTADGRTDESIGVVTIGSMKGDSLANALMKAETKAKRRVTLSICGLGFTDETEVPTIMGAQRVTVDGDGVIIEQEPKMLRGPIPAPVEAAAPVDDWLTKGVALNERMGLAKTKGDLLEAWADANAAKRAGMPASVFEPLRALKDKRKAELDEKAA